MAKRGFPRPLTRKKVKVKELARYWGVHVNTASKIAKKYDLYDIFSVYDMMKANEWRAYRATSERGEAV